MSFGVYYIKLEVCKSIDSYLYLKFVLVGGRGVVLLSVITSGLLIVLNTLNWR